MTSFHRQRSLGRAIVSIAAWLVLQSACAAGSAEQRSSSINSAPASKPKAWARASAFNRYMERPVPKSYAPTPPATPDASPSGSASGHQQVQATGAATTTQEQQERNYQADARAFIFRPARRSAATDSSGLSRAAPTTGAATSAAGVPVKAFRLSSASGMANRGGGRARGAAADEAGSSGAVGASRTSRISNPEPGRDRDQRHGQVVQQDESYENKISMLMRRRQLADPSLAGVAASSSASAVSKRPPQQPQQEELPRAPHNLPTAARRSASAPNVVLGPHAPPAPPVPLTGRSISSRAIGPEPQLRGKEFSLVHEGLEMISFFNIDTGEHLHTLPAAANLRQFVKYLNARAAVETSQGTAPAREVMRFEYANATFELLPNPEDETDADTVMQMKMSPTNTDPHGDGMGISRRPVTNCGELAEYLFRQVRQRSVPRFVPRSLYGVGLPGPAAGDSVPQLTLRDIHAHIDVQFRQEVPVVMKVAEEQVVEQEGAPARSDREVGVARETLLLPVSMLVREVTEFFENPVYKSRVRGYVSKFQYLVEDFSAVTSNGPRKVEVVAAEWRRDNDEAFEVTAYDLRALANLLWDRIDLSKMRHGEKPSIDQVRRNITAVLAQMPGQEEVAVKLQPEVAVKLQNFHDIGRTVPSTPTPAGGREIVGLGNSSVVSAGTIVPAGPSVGPVPSHDGSAPVSAGAIVPALPRPGQETGPQTVAPDITSATVVPAALLSSAPSQAGTTLHPTLIGPAIHRKLEVRSTVLTPQGQVVTAPSAPGAPLHDQELFLRDAGHHTPGGRPRALAASPSSASGTGMGTGTGTGAAVASVPVASTASSARDEERSSQHQRSEQAQESAASASSSASGPTFNPSASLKSNPEEPVTRRSSTTSEPGEGAAATSVSAPCSQPELQPQRQQDPAPTRPSSVPPPSYTGRAPIFDDMVRVLQSEARRIGALLDDQLALQREMQSRRRRNTADEAALVSSAPAPQAKAVRVAEPSSASSGVARGPEDEQPQMLTQPQSVPPLPNSVAPEEASPAPTTTARSPGARGEDDELLAAVAESGHRQIPAAGFSPTGVDGTQAEEQRSCVSTPAGSLDFLISLAEEAASTDVLSHQGAGQPGPALPPRPAPPAVLSPAAASPATSPATRSPVRRDEQPSTAAVVPAQEAGVEPAPQRHPLLRDEPAVLIASSPQRRRDARASRPAISSSSAALASFGSGAATPAVTETAPAAAAASGAASSRTTEESDPHLLSVADRIQRIERCSSAAGTPSKPPLVVDSPRGRCRGTAGNTGRPSSASGGVMFRGTSSVVPAPDTSRAAAGTGGSGRSISWSGRGTASTFAAGSASVAAASSASVRAAASRAEVGQFRPLPRGGAGASSRARNATSSTAACTGRAPSVSSRGVQAVPQTTQQETQVAAARHSPEVHHPNRQSRQDSAPTGGPSQQPAAPAPARSTTSYASAPSFSSGPKAAAATAETRASSAPQRQLYLPFSQANLRGPWGDGERNTRRRDPPQLSCLWPRARPNAASTTSAGNEPASQERHRYGAVSREEQALFERFLSNDELRRRQKQDELAPAAPVLNPTSPTQAGAPGCGSRSPGSAPQLHPALSPPSRAKVSFFPSGDNTARRSSTAGIDIQRAPAVPQLRNAADRSPIESPPQRGKSSASAQASSTSGAAAASSGGLRPVSSPALAAAAPPKAPAQRHVRIAAHPELRSGVSSSDEEDDPWLKDLLEIADAQRSRLPRADGRPRKPAWEVKRDAQRAARAAMTEFLDVTDRRLHQSEMAQFLNDADRQLDAYERDLQAERRHLPASSSASVSAAAASPAPPAARPAAPALSTTRQVYATTSNGIEGRRHVESDLRQNASDGEENYEDDFEPVGDDSSSAEDSEAAAERTRRFLAQHDGYTEEELQRLFVAQLRF